MLKHHFALRLCLFLGLLVLAGVAALAWLLTHTSSQALLQQTGEGARDSAEVVARVIKHEMLEGRAKELCATFCQITGDTRLENLWLFRPDGRLVVSSKKGHHTAQGEAGQVCRSCHGKVGSADLRKGRSWSRVALAGEQKVRAAVHLPNEPACHRCHSARNPLLGVLVADAPLTHARVTAKKMTLWSLSAAGVLFLLLCLALFLLVERMVHKPLKTLEATMGRLVAGDRHSHLPVLGEDEIGHLAEGFNFMAADMEEKVERLEALATSDYLTGLFNHRAFQERLKTEISRAQRYAHPCSLLLVDIDHFKRVNEAHGYQAGDEVLKQLAGLLQANLRESDIAGRYGGEEFAALLPESDLAEAQAVAERMRAAVQGQAFMVSAAESISLAGAEPLRLTVSIGLAGFPADSSQPEGVVMAAEVALLRAKHISRNLVCAYGALAPLGDADDPYLLHRCLKEASAESAAALVEEMEARDPYLQGHSRRVAELALETAQQIGLSPKEQECLRLAALLHDIGKIGIPLEILDKPDGLTQVERQFINSHPAVGGAILKTIGRLAGLAPVVVHHHERYDGGGYPDGLRAENIPLLARILAATDAVDAMLSDRPYRPALTLSQAMAELQGNSGSQFDPAIAGALTAVLHRKAAVAAV